MAASERPFDAMPSVATSWMVHYDTTVMMGVPLCSLELFDRELAVAVVVKLGAFFSLRHVLILQGHMSFRVERSKRDSHFDKFALKKNRRETCTATGFFSFHSNSKMRENILRSPPWSSVGLIVGAQTPYV